MRTDLPTTKIPLQNLITVSHLAPRLRNVGVHTLEHLERWISQPRETLELVSEAELASLTQALERFRREQQFCATFKWELLAYAPEVQGEFARKAPEVFEEAFGKTRLTYLSIPTRTLRALEQEHLETVGDVLAAQPRLLAMKNLGERSVGELFRILGQFGRVYRYMLGNLWSTTERNLTPPLLVRAVITPLKEREREIVTKRYGLDGSRELTLRETGEALGISRERARQIQSRTMEKLREGTSLALIHDWLDLHLPHLIHRTLLQMGGLATTQEIQDRVHASGFSLTLLADILERDVGELLDQQHLTRIGDQLWAINPPFAALCQDARAALQTLALREDLKLPDPEALEEAQRHFRASSPLGRKHAPSLQFLKNVALRLAYFP